MDKQNEMMMARRKSKRQAKFEDSADVAKKLLAEAEANDLSHKTAHEQEKNKQGDMVCDSFLFQSITYK